MIEKYYIKFDTNIRPGKLEATVVTLDVVNIEDMNISLRIDLCAHPLYRDLYEYVKGNPPR